MQHAQQISLQSCSRMTARNMCQVERGWQGGKCWNISVACYGKYALFSVAQSQSHFCLWLMYDVSLKPCEIPLCPSHVKYRCVQEDFFTLVSHPSKILLRDDVKTVVWTLLLDTVASFLVQILCISTRQVICTMRHASHVLQMCLLRFNERSLP